MWTLKIALGRVLPRSSHVTSAGKELSSVSVDCTWPFDDDVLRVCRRNHHDISVARRDIVARFVMFSLWTAEQTSLSGELQGHVTFQFNSAHDEISGRNQHDATLFVRARIDC